MQSCRKWREPTVCPVNNSSMSSSKKKGEKVLIESVDKRPLADLLLAHQSGCQQQQSLDIFQDYLQEKIFYTLLLYEMLPYIYNFFLRLMTNKRPLSCWMITSLAADVLVISPQSSLIYIWGIIIDKELFIINSQRQWLMMMLRIS